MAKQEGYVYFLATVDWQFTKIGRAGNLDSRIKTLKIQLPFKADLVHAVRSDDCAWLESMLHRDWAQFRRNGEWFYTGSETMFRSYFRLWLGRDYWDRELQNNYEQSLKDATLYDEIQQYLGTADFAISQMEEIADRKAYVEWMWGNG